MSTKYCVWVLTVVLTGCTLWGITEIGKLHDQKTHLVGNYRVQLNLHEVKWATRGTYHSVYTRGATKELWVWCQTDKTAALNLSHQLGEYEKVAAFAKTGWKSLWVNSALLTAIPKDFIGILFHEGTSKNPTFTFAFGA